MSIHIGQTSLHCDHRVWKPFSQYKVSQSGRVNVVLVDDARTERADEVQK